MKRQTFIYNSLEFEHPDNGLKQNSHGYYEFVSGGVLLRDRAKQPQALVCTNERNTAFTVTAYPVSNGIRYMYSTTLSTERFLNIENKSCGDCIDISEQSITQLRKSVQKRYTGVM